MTESTQLQQKRRNDLESPEAATNQRNLPPEKKKSRRRIASENLPQGGESGAAAPGPPGGVLEYMPLVEKTGAPIVQVSPLKDFFDKDGNLIVKYLYLSHHNIESPNQSFERGNFKITGPTYPVFRVFRSKFSQLFSLKFFSRRRG